MKIVITMAGRGQRFRDVGYTCPKYMISVLEKSLFEWSLLSLCDFFEHTFVFICRKEDNASAFIKQKCNDLKISNFNIVELDHTTDGQATTVLSASAYISPSDSIVIYNIDTFVEEGTLLASDLRGDGFIPGFVADGDKWSFIAMDEDQLVTDIAEKVPISNIATLGFYYFTSFNEYLKVYHETFQDAKNLVNGEKYIAPMYKQMISGGMTVFGQVIPQEFVWGLGTPEDVDKFFQSYE